MNELHIVNKLELGIKTCCANPASENISPS